MGKLYTIKKHKNIFSLPKHSSLEKLFQKGLIDEKSKFLEMDFYEGEGYAQFILRLERDLKKTRNVTLLILSCTLVIEGVLDLIFIKIYKLNKYRRVSPFELLSKINLNKKIELIKKLRKCYPRKQPKRKEYKHHVSFSSSFLRELKKKYGEQIMKDMKSIEDELNRKEGIKPPSNFPAVITLEKTPDPDYLPDDIVDFLKRINIREIKKIVELRNIVSHNWGPEESIAKKLQVKKSKLNPTVRALCLNAVNNLLELQIK
jgi:hypothetical protein